jgi:hypothetical protein
MDIRVPIPLDEEGVCPPAMFQMQWEFKWRYGPANEEAEAEPSAPVYYCPLCGEPAPSGSDAWLTEERLA